MSTKVGIQFTWSKFFANTALMKPPSENTIDGEHHRREDHECVVHGSCVKISETMVTAPPTMRPRTSPPPT